MTDRTALEIGCAGFCIHSADSTSFPLLFISLRRFGCSGLLIQIALQAILNGILDCQAFLSRTHHGRQLTDEQDCLDVDNGLVLWGSNQFGPDGPKLFPGVVLLTLGVGSNEQPAAMHAYNFSRPDKALHLEYSIGECQKEHDHQD